MRIYADLSSEALWLPEWQRALQPEDLRLSLRDPVGNGAREYPRGFRRSAEIRVGSVQRNCIHIPNRRPHSLVPTPPEGSFHLDAAVCFGASGASASVDARHHRWSLQEPDHLRRLLRSGRHPRRRGFLHDRVELRLCAWTADWITRISACSAAVRRRRSFRLERSMHQRARGSRLAPRCESIRDRSIFASRSRIARCVVSRTASTAGAGRRSVSHSRHGKVAGLVRRLVCLL